MKKLVAVLLAFAMLLGLCACGGGGSTDPTQAAPAESGSEAASGTRMDKITVAINADPEHLKPYNGNGGSKPIFYNNIYEALFDYDDDNNLVPCIGKSINIIDSTHYEVEIYDCVYDSQGNHITADDVCASIKWLVDEGEAVKFEVFANVEVVDDYTVQFTWAYEPTTWDDFEFPFTRCWIFSQKAMQEGNFATTPVGTGPYVVESYVAGSSLVLKANDDYWLLKNPEIMDEHLDIRRANVETIEFKVIAEAAQAQIALEQGTVDFCDYVQTMAMGEFEEGGQYSDKYTVSASEKGDFFYLQLNMWDGKFGADVNFRKAIFNAIDSAAVTMAMGGEYAPMNTIGNSAFPDWDDRWNKEDTIMNTVDVEKAKEYLAKTNYKGEEISLLCGNTESITNAATMIQTQLLEIGVNIKINSLQDSLANTALADPNGWDMNLGSIGGTSLTGAYNRMLGGQQQHVDGKDYTLFFTQDEKLEGLYQTAKAAETHDFEHLDELIKYATEEQSYVYALAEMSTAIVVSNKIDQLYIRETTYPNFGPSVYAGYEAEHSANVKPIIMDLPEPSELPENVHIFYQIFNPDDGAGMVWTLTLNNDESWTLKLESTKEDIMAEVHNYTGDKTFPDDSDPTLVTTTPPMEKDSDDEFAKRGEFYEPDGVCKWKVMDNHGLCPVNYADFDNYVATWESDPESLIISK